MISSKTIFIIGANGVGKTSIILPLQILLGGNFAIYDFDERGVPNNVGKNWRQEETRHWLEVGRENSEKNISTIICGFAKPAEINETKNNNETVIIILLDADADIIARRIWNRYPTPESILQIEKTVAKPIQKFIDDNIYYSSILREDIKKLGAKIINTSKLNPEEVAKEVYDYLSS